MECFTALYGILIGMRLGETPVELCRQPPVCYFADKIQKEVFA